MLLPSVLIGTLKHVGWVAPRLSAAFFARAGAEREVFLPFFYRWFDDRQWAQDQALRLMRATVTHERIPPPSVFHAPFTGRYGPYFRVYRRDLSDARRVQEHGKALARECAFFGRVRQEFGVGGRILYILHLGLRAGRTVREALRATLEAIRPAVDAASRAGVVLALENVADRSGEEGFVGARLPEISQALGELGAGAERGSPIGWTFDIAHALLAYRGDAEAIASDLQDLLPTLVHLHVNAPRFYPSEAPWADRHEAPHEGFRPLWDLLRLALGSPSFQEFRTVTYEVNWAAPWLNPLVGGSPLPDVIRGYHLVERVVAEELARVDERHGAPYTVGTPALSPSPLRTAGLSAAPPVQEFPPSS